MGMTIEIDDLDDMCDLMCNNVVPVKSGVAKCIERFDYTDGSITINIRVSQEWKFHRRQNGYYWLRRNNVEMIIPSDTFKKYFAY